MAGKRIWLLFLLAYFSISVAAVPAGSQDKSPQTPGNQPKGDLLLHSFLEEALDRNPGIRQSFARYEASLQKLPQISALPDPMLNLTQYIRSPETRVGPQTTSFSISQKLPWFGKLGDSENIAAKEAAVMRSRLEAQRAEVVRQVKLAYYGLGYIDCAIEITNDDIALLNHYEELARSRYQQGIGLQQAVVKLQAEITKDQYRLEMLKSQRVDLEAVLNSLRDYPSDAPIGRIDLGIMPGIQIHYEDLYHVGRNNRPEIREALMQIEKNEKRIHLVKKNYWPDVTIGAGFTNVTGRSDPAGIMNPPDQNGKNIYSFSLGINIPIQRRKYDAAVAEATQDKIASREGYRNAVNSMEASIRSIGFRIETLQRQIALFEKTLVPQAEQALGIQVDFGCAVQEHRHAGGELFFRRLVGEQEGHLRQRPQQERGIGLESLQVLLGRKEMQDVQDEIRIFFGQFQDRLMAAVLEEAHPGGDALELLETNPVPGGLLGRRVQHVAEQGNVQPGILVALGMQPAP